MGTLDAISSSLIARLAFSVAVLFAYVAFEEFILHAVGCCRFASPSFKSIPLVTLGAVIREGAAEAVLRAPVNDFDGRESRGD